MYLKVNSLVVITSRKEIKALTAYINLNELFNFEPWFSYLLKNNS